MNKSARALLAKIEDPLGSTRSRRSAPATITMQFWEGQTMTDETESYKVPKPDSPWWELNAAIIRAHAMMRATNPSEGCYYALNNHLIALLEQETNYFERADHD